MLLSGTKAELSSKRLVAGHMPLRLFARARAPWLFLLRGCPLQARSNRMADPRENAPQRKHWTHEPLVAKLCPRPGLQGFCSKAALEEAERQHKAHRKRFPPSQLTRACFGCFFCSHSPYCAASPSSVLPLGCVLPCL